MYIRKHMMDKEDNSSIGKISLDEIYRTDILNIFSDASIRQVSKNLAYGCHGTVVVCRDTILDRDFKIDVDSTNNLSEIRGLRMAVRMVNKWKTAYKNINIFSDSKISVDGIRHYIYHWKLGNDGLLYNSQNQPVKNQEIFIETYQLLTFIKSTNPSLNINIYHQAGHISNGYDSLNKASNVFKRSNQITKFIDLNFIRYISTWNSWIDNFTRSELYRADLKIQYEEPITFHWR